MTKRRSYDVVILGSGFAGSLLATILASRGVSVALIDRSKHPRFVIGESSTPAADFLLHKLVMQYQLPELAPLVRFGTWQESCPEILCGCKRGFSYLWHGDGNEYRATPDHRCELLVAASDSRSVADTQWYRPDVDARFAEVARCRGVCLLESANVVAIRHPVPQHWEFTVETAGDRDTIETAFAVDATGPTGLLLNWLKVADASEQLRTHSSAVYSHWDNVRSVESWLRSAGGYVDDYPFPIDDAAVHHLFHDGWVWRLRFENGRTSLGFVFSGGPDANRRAPDAATLWASLLEQKPVLQAALGGIELASLPGKVLASPRLQRLAATGAGEDWAALPFTVGFIDPLHSTGIAHSLSGVERLSALLLADGPSQRKAALEHYSQSIIAELLHIDRLVSGCYTGLCDFRLFTAWSMIYFAAATHYERGWKSCGTAPRGFLCADQSDFVDTVTALSERLAALDSQRLLRHEPTLLQLCDAIQESLEPFNHVGLFRPQQPNLYARTAIGRP